MPDAPSVNPLTVFFFENPLPLGGVLALVAAVLIWTGLRQGTASRMQTGVAFGVLAVVAVAVSLLVRTSGERAKAVTRQFVEAVVAEDLVRAMDLVAADGTLAVGSIKNPGWDRIDLRRQLTAFADQFDITNRIRQFDAFSTSPDEGTVHLGCSTRTEDAYGPIATGWEIRVRRDSDDEWRVHRLVWLTMGKGRPARGDLLVSR